MGEHVGLEENQVLVLSVDRVVVVVVVKRGLELVVR